MFGKISQLTNDKVENITSEQPCAQLKLLLQKGRIYFADLAIFTTGTTQKINKLRDLHCLKPTMDYYLRKCKLVQSIQKAICQYLVK